MSRLVCIGGVDPSGGAGLVRDAWTLRRFAPTLPHAFVVSAWTRQGRGRPAESTSVEPEVLLGQLAAIQKRHHASGSTRLWLKLGLVPEDLVDPLDAWLGGADVDGVVLDPVVRASDGGQLGASAASLLRLAGRVSLWTPNPDESGALGAPLAEGGLWLLKGAASGPTEVGDRLVGDAIDELFRRPRVDGLDPRGTGCALATAIAAGLASGQGPVDACRAAIDWLDQARTRTAPGPDGRPHMR